MLKNNGIVLEMSQLKGENQRLLGAMAFINQFSKPPSENKQSTFMFAYYGRYILRGVLLDTIQYVENGVFSEDMKYCVIKLTAKKTRRESGLSNIINEYNAAVGLEGHITLVAVPITADRSYPLIMPARLWSGNPIEIKRNNDKKLMNSSFRFFTNRALPLFKEGPNQTMVQAQP